MKSIKLPGMDLPIGEGQPEYTVLHAAKIPGADGELLMCFELSDEEMAILIKTKRIYYSRLRFDNACQKCQAPLLFQPMRLFVDGVTIFKEPSES
jgi:hypothetical protein